MFSPMTNKNNIIAISGVTIIIIVIVTIIILKSRKENLRLGANYADISEDIIKNDIHTALTNRNVYPNSSWYF